jgi:hypothetical protein
VPSSALPPVEIANRSECAVAASSSVVAIVLATHLDLKGSNAIWVSASET